jgi:hypothetical protein
MNAPDFSLRGHHFLCTLHYQGAGYSTAFNDNFTALCHNAVARQHNTVAIAEQADEICGACPSLQPDGQSCRHQASIMNRDQALLDAMGWRPGQIVDLAAAYNEILPRREALMDKVCTGCEWRSTCDSNGPYGLMSPLNHPASP